MSSLGLVILKCEKIIWTSLSGWFTKMWDEIYCLHLNARVWKLVYQVPDKIWFWSMVLAYCEMYSSVWVWTIMFERLFLRFFPLFLGASILLFTYLVVIRIWFQVTWAEGGILNQYASYKLDSGVEQTTLVNFQSIFTFWLVSIWCSAGKDCLIFQNLSYKGVGLLIPILLQRHGPSHSWILLCMCKRSSENNQNVNFFSCYVC